LTMLRGRPSLRLERAMANSSDRRVFLVASGLSGAAFLLGCTKSETPQPDRSQSPPAPAAETKADAHADDEPEVTATEDLMREHGVIRRAIVVYREAATRLRTKPAAVPLDALAKTAKLLRTFAEDYHEKQLEEAYLFPAVKKAGGAAAALVDTLIAQHARGREITEYVSAVAAGPLGAKADPLARALEGFARMYEEHAAFEDTIVFPAWKRTMSAKELDAMGDKFEEIEHKTFGKDGFDDAVDQITAIEAGFGLELAQFTAPPPPKP
jgi:hemerythrin-like domain-containing protein